MSDTENTAQDEQAQINPINILAQYIRDLSFENPNTPESLRSDLGVPDMGINVGMDARKLEDDDIEGLYEVVLNMRASAQRDETPIFIAELQYAATVQLNGLPEDSHHPVLLIEVPTLLFPYARQIMSDMTMKGGYPPLMLSPVDFRALYVERFKDEIDAARDSAKEAEKAEESVE